jgi:AAA+ superfamily predicted ATPase
VSTISVIVAATTPDVLAVGIEAAVRRRSDMSLAGGRVLTPAEVGAKLQAIPPSSPCVVLAVGASASKTEFADRWLAARKDLVVACVDIVEHAVRIETQDPKLEMASFLDALRDLVSRDGRAPSARIAHFRLHAVSGEGERHPVASWTSRAGPLLVAAIDWIHAVLHAALDSLVGEGGDLPGLTLNPATLRSVMQRHSPREATTFPEEIAGVDAALDAALRIADVHSEGLASVAESFGLTPLEFRILLLALAPEIDLRYQRCMGVLLDDLSRRVGTLGLCAALVGGDPSKIRRDLARSGNLARWRLFDGRGGVLPSADEPLRIDPAIVGWVLGETAAMEHDPRLRRLLRIAPWAGANLFESRHDRVQAADLVARLRSRGVPQWLLLAGGDTSGWRALVELGAASSETLPIRVDAARLSGLDFAEIEEAAVRLGRLARLTTRPLVIDTCNHEATAPDVEGLRLLFSAIAASGVRAGIVSDDAPNVVRLLGPSLCTINDESSLLASRRANAMQTAARALEIPLDSTGAEALAQKYPIPFESVEHALQIARAQRDESDNVQQRHHRFKMACQDVAAAGVSRLAERIEPAFELRDVVLPTDRARQLGEIVNSVMLAPKVLDDWQFRSRLPYGRGVSALFHGPSGTGKTMAAHGIARALGIQMLRIDLSRVVSKFIGETEKNLDRVFIDAHRSGAAILIDEADALLGKRSEVKDAHDRYANIEVAFLLQRMEAFEGLAILTTNMRQNLDAAFLRRLRFIVDFPRPDPDAREKIWRSCLPPDSHSIDEAGFRQLARRIELTGGHIRQITVRAAFAAAADGARIGLRHVAYACQAEFAKLGMPGVELDYSQQRRAA